MRDQPVGLVRPDDHHHAARRADALHLRKPPLAAVGGLGRQGGAGGDQLGRTVGGGEGIGEPADDADAPTLPSPRGGGYWGAEVVTKTFPQRLSRLDSGEGVAATDQVAGEASGSRAGTD